jgi:glutamine amidotransferase-like uncharacterized protein
MDLAFADLLCLNKVVFARRLFIVSMFVLLVIGTTGCRTSGDRGSVPLNKGARILLFNGKGISPNDVAAIESILYNNQLTYSTVNSVQLNKMSEVEMRKYRLLIVPGGDFVEMGKSLTKGASMNIHNAVQKGLNYLGICAGGFLAGKSEYYNGFDLTSGTKFGFYSAENQGMHKAALSIAGPGETALDQYWEDGPQFTGWGDVIGKYPDGTPALVEGASGKGWVILSGIHAEAPEYWRQGMIVNTPADKDNAYAATLIRAALNGISLPHY